MCCRACSHRVTQSSSSWAVPSGFSRLKRAQTFPSASLVNSIASRGLSAGPSLMCLSLPCTTLAESHGSAPSLPGVTCHSAAWAHPPPRPRAPSPTPCPIHLHRRPRSPPAHWSPPRPGQRVPCPLNSCRSPPSRCARTEVSSSIQRGRATRSWRGTAWSA